VAGRGVADLDAEIGELLPKGVRRGEVLER